MNKNCIECGNHIDERVYDYSTHNFGIPLCMFHQNWVKNMECETTNETLELYFALKQRNVPAEIEKFDGFKHIDIAVTDAKVNIEIDGSHHNWQPQQALADLKRTYFSFKKGYLTLRIPNSLVHNHLEETADLITEILIENKTQIKPVYKYSKR